MAQRFYSRLDLDTFDKFNKELVGDAAESKDGIIFQQVDVYKISVKDTRTNIYGETVGGKVFRDGVRINAIVDAADQTTNTDEFGPDRVQTVTFSFLRQSLRDISFVVDVVVKIKFDERIIFVELVRYNPYLMFPRCGFPKTLSLFLCVL